MIRLGLTGSIAMGKSTAADLFAEFGVPVYSADAQVHKLYREKFVQEKIEAAFPGTVYENQVDRQRLSRLITQNSQALKQLEAIVHPLLRTHEQAFLRQAETQPHRLVVLDIPLLYETGAEARLDCVAVVSAPFALQRQRVLARAHMDEEKFNLILARQLPDEEKRKRADFIIDSSHGLATMRAMISSLYSAFSATLEHS